MLAFRDAAGLMGLPPGVATQSDVSVLQLIQRGLPTKSVDRLASLLAPRDTAFKYRIVPKASLARAMSERRLNRTQSVAVARLASVVAQALRIWKSEEEPTREFLFRAHPILDGHRPIDLVLESEIGADLVRNLLGRLEAGTAP